MPIFFETAAQSGAWLALNGASESEVIVGIHKRSSGLVETGRSSARLSCLSPRAARGIFCWSFSSAHSRRSLALLGMTKQANRVEDDNTKMPMQSADQ
jgi:hypothetical protein